MYLYSLLISKVRDEFEHVILREITNYPKNLKGCLVYVFENTYFFFYLKTCVKIRMGEKVCRNA